MSRQFELINVDTTLQAADILTKAFDSTPVWHHALELIGISPNRQARPCATSLLHSPSTAAGELSDQGGQIAALRNAQPKRLLIEFCSSTTSRLQSASANNHSLQSENLSPIKPRILRSFEQCM